MLCFAPSLLVNLLAPDGIPNEMLLNDGVGLELALMKLFNHIWGTNSWPPDWQR